MRRYNFIDLTGKRFGRLTVLHIAKERGNHSEIRWDCICDCGNLHTASGESLRGGKSKSCGCLRCDFVPPNKLDDRYEFLRYRLYKNLIIKRSKNLKRDFDLTYEDFCEIITQPCFYCGAINTNYIRDYSNRTNRLISDTVIYYNGIDRIDSNLGYLKTNSVSCCKRCNMAKNNMSIEEFKNWIIKIYNNYVIKNCNVGKQRLENNN
jgi:hypothetical protein